jgi:hypothetical protein
MSRLANLECPSCGGPLGGREAAPLSATCSECGVTEPVLLDADGAPRDVRRPDPDLFQLGMWVRAVRELVKGEVVCVGACAACAGPLMVPSAHPVRLPCNRCGGHREIEAGSVVAQPIHGLNAGFHASTFGGSFDIDYTIERVEAPTLEGHKCPQCGAPAPPGHRALECDYCGSRLWMVDVEGDRYTYVLAMRGHRDGQPVDERVALGDAEEVIRRDAELFEGAFTVIKIVGPMILLVVFLFLAFVLWVSFSFFRTFERLSVP